MKKPLVIIIAAVAVVGLAVFLLLKDKPINNAPDEAANTGISEESGQPAEAQGDKLVFIDNYAYSPQELIISAGETVTWTNNSQVRHDVTSDTGNELGSKLLSQGESYSHTFNEAGEYAYHCTPHPFMKAKIIVQ